MTFDNFKFRASELGNIVTPSGKITQGTETFLNEKFIEAIYGVRREAYGKAMDKGIACESDGLKMLNTTLYPERFIKKIDELKENDFIKGTPDTIIDGIVYDIKNAWDRFTFGKASLTHLYQWQLKAYMMLHGITKGRLFYCLNNMPDYLLIDEEQKMFYTQKKWSSKEDTDYLKACEDLRAAHNYDSMPVHHRFKVWDVDYSEKDAEKIIACVNQAREYLNGLLVEHSERLVNNLQLMVCSHDKEVQATMVELG